MSQIVLRCLQLALMYLLISRVNPAIAEWLIGLPSVVTEIIAAFVGAALTELMLGLILRPQIQLDWKEIGNPTPLPRIDLSKAALREGRAVYELAITGRSRSLLGLLVFWLLTKRDLGLLIEIPVAPLYMTSDRSQPLRLTTKALQEVDFSDGLRANLARMPPRGETRWVWGRVIFTATGEPSNEAFAFKTKALTSTNRSQLCAKVLSRRVSANEVRLY